MTMKTSAWEKHAIDTSIHKTGHAGPLEDFRILYKANSNFYVLIHERLLISRDRPAFNQQNSFIPLYLV